MFSTTGRIPPACATASIPSPSNSKRISPCIPAGSPADRTLGCSHRDYSHASLGRISWWCSILPARSFKIWCVARLSKVRFFRLNSECPTGVLARPPALQPFGHPTGLLRQKLGVIRRRSRRSPPFPLRDPSLFARPPAAALCVPTGIERCSKR